MMTHDKLGINKNIGTEDEGRNSAVNQLSRRIVGKEHGYETEQDEGPERAKEVGHPRGEIILGLACEQSQEDEDAGREDDGVENNRRLVEGDDDGNRVGFGEGEEREEEQVSWVRLAFPVG